MDQLSNLLSRFGVRAKLFYNEKLCGVETYGGTDQKGHLHLLHSGSVRIHGINFKETELSEPTLIFLPRPRRHKMFADSTDGAQLLCATVEFEGGLTNPVSSSLPDVMILPLSQLTRLSGVLDWMFTEASDKHCGMDAVINRLFDILIIMLFRHLLDHNLVVTGLMAGLADPRLSRSLIKIHDDPVHPWSVGELAEHASMSRTAFSNHFRDVMGQTPADYLLSWRVSLAQKLLREGRPINLIANDVGYESPSALSRAFKRKTGHSPRNWSRDEVASDSIRV